jgi:putative MATE family efflux protein
MDHVKQLGEAPVGALMLKFSIPAIIGMVINQTYMIVDQIFIGHGIGSMGIAAITAGFPLMVVMMSLGLLVGVGSTTLVSLRLGEKDIHQAEIVLGNSFLLLMVASLLPLGCGLLFLDPLLTFFGADAQVLPYAHQYLQILLFGSVFIIIGVGMNQMIGASGHPGTALLTILLGALLNVLLCPLFIFWFGWGMAGAAWATFTAQGVSACWVVAHFFPRKRPGLRLRLRNLVFHPPITATILSIGLPVFLMESMMALLSIVLNKSLVHYGGNTALAAIGIVNGLAMLLIFPLFGLNQGCQPIIGYNYGANLFLRVKKTLSLAIITATVMVTIGFALVQLFAEQIIAAFGTHSPELIVFGGHALRIFLLMLPVAGIHIIAVGYFQAIGQPHKSMLFMISRQLLLLVLILFVLPPLFGLDGVLYAAPVADLVAACVAGSCLSWEFTRLKTLQVEPVSP